MHIDLLDIAILIGLAIGLANGHRRGFWLSLMQYLGLVVGVVVGAALAPKITHALGITSSVGAPLAAVLILVVGGSLGSSLGYWIGEPVRVRLLGGPTRGEPDSIAGAVLSLVAVLGVVWFLGLTFRDGPSPQLARLIQTSTILHRLDAVAPRPPAFLGGVAGVLAGVPFPETFAGLEPPLPSPLPTPNDPAVRTPGVRLAESRTVKVLGQGCGGEVSGSAFPVGPHLFLTNAHVVSGTSGTRVVLADGTTSYPAQVVVFDPGRDVAILYVPGYGLPALADSGAGRGTQGAVIGYPGGGARRTVPAVVDDSMNAQGRDIYNQNLVTRQIWVIESDVRPGNSGGPLVNVQGQVIGVIYAASTSHPRQGYALTDAEVAPDVQAAQNRTSPIDTSQYACAA
ncbi:MAG: MarP family serine protease [Candidatus Dormibacteraceae bacterium]